VAALVGNPAGREWFYKAADLGGPFGSGKSPDNPSSDMSEIFGQIESGDSIFVRGGVYANLVAPRVTDIAIIGASTRPRHDKPTGTELAEVERGAAAWRTASGVTDEPLLTVRAQGWRLANMLFAGPSGAPGINGTRTAEDDDQEDASHLEILGCRLVGGTYGFLQTDGVGHIKIADCDIQGATTAALGSESEGIANPLRWLIENNRFTPHRAGALGNVAHIVAPLNSSIIRGNVFGTVVSTGKYIDLTGGADNFVCENVLGGVYDSNDYVAGTGDLWLGNWVTVKATQAPDGSTILPPA
jgi:hypothetical protein